MMMRILFAAILCAISTTARADNYTATAGGGLTFGAKLIGGILYPWWIPTNSSGTELFTSANPGFVQIGDGTNGPAAVKAASTAAIATDKSLVTQTSPNDPVLGAPGATACASDTASCNTNQQMQRLAQRLSTINTTLGSPFQAGGTISLPSGASTSAIQTNGTQKTQIVDGSGNVIGSTSNNLNVQCANCSGSGASGTDEGTFTAGSSVFAPGGGFFQTTATNNPLTTGQWGAWQMTANRAGFVNLRNASGTEVGTASNQFQVGAPASAFADGWNVTMGTKADALWTSGSGSEISLLKTVATNTGGPLAAQQSAGIIIGAVTPSVATVGGALQYSEVVPNNTTGVSIKNAPGTIYDAQLYNLGTVPLYVRLYDTSSAPTCGSGTIKKRLMIPANTTPADGAGSNLSFGTAGIAFATGIGMCVTAGFPDADTTTPASNVGMVSFDYD